jgi:hypothetical protein
LLWIPPEIIFQQLICSVSKDELRRAFNNFIRKNTSKFYLRRVRVQNIGIWGDKLNGSKIHIQQIQEEKVAFVNTRNEFNANLFQKHISSNLVAKIIKWHSGRQTRLLRENDAVQFDPVALN